VPLTELSEEQIVKNWNVYEKFCHSVSEPRCSAISKMLEAIGSELAVTPASARVDFHNAFSGGLVEHSLRVLRNAVKYSSSMLIPVDRESLIIATLFHDLGKIGDGKRPYYVPQPDKWRREHRGEMYAHNDKLTYMSVPLRGLFILNSFGVTLKEDEWLSIYLNDGWVVQENKTYCLKEPPLVHVVQTADYLATLQEKRGDDLSLGK